MTDILDKLRSIFRDVFDDSEMIITNATSPADISEWDSLAQINIIAAAEAEFGIKFGINDISCVKSVGDLAEIIKRMKEDE